MSPLLFMSKFCTPISLCQRYMLTNVMPIAIGIDLGTAQTSVGVYMNSEIHIIPNDLGKRYTPSYVSFTDSDILIGERAKAQSIENHMNTIFGVKRFIGRRYDDPCLKEDMKLFPYSIENHNGTPKICVTYKKEKRVFDPEEISAMIIYEMKRNVEILLGHQITDAIITVPAFFNDSQRQATKDAGSIAGLNVLRIFNEPTAAALAYGIDKTTKDEKKVLIYDFGEGTFDASVLHIKQGNIFEVRSAVGDTHLGGIEINNIMLKYFSDLFFKECGKDIMKDIQAVRRLTLACEEAKIALSTEKEAGIFLGNIIDGKDLDLSISREKFEELCEPIFNRTIEFVERGLHESGFNVSDIDDVVLVGGFTKMPKVHSLVSSYFGEKNISRSVNPDEAVTYGAAIQAAILHGYKDGRIKDMMYVDVTPLSIGIETAGGMMTTIIKRGTSIPCKETYVVTTHSDKQPGMTIRVFEGERVLAANNHLLGKLELNDFPPVPRGVPRIEVTFEIDSNGILTLSAEEKSFMKPKKSISMRFEKDRLSPDDIDRALKEAQEFEKQDQDERDKIHHRRALQKYVYSINKVAVSRQQSKISDRDKLEIQKICNETYDWLNTNPSIDQESLIEKRKTMIRQLQPYASLLNLSAITDDGVDSIAFSSTEEN